jgi:two-component system OmpR family sensor kinase
VTGPGRPVRRRWPLRRRLTALTVAVVGTVLAGVVIGFMVLVFGSLYDDVDDRLREATRSARAAYPFTDAVASPVAADVTVEVADGGGATLRILQRHTRAGPGQPEPADAARAIAVRQPVTAGPADRQWRLLAERLPDGTWLVAAQPVGELQARHSRLVVVWSVVTLVALALTTVFASRVVGYGLRPLAGLAAEAGRVEAGDLSRRLPDTGRDEVGRLATALNRMLERIEASFAERKAVEERLRRFVDDAGHELRTPVTAIRGWAELYQRGGVTGADLPTAMRRIGDEAHRMGVLVDQLLLLASLDRPAAAPGAPPRRVVDLAEVVRDAVLDAQAVEPDRPLTADLPPDGTALLDGDPMALHQVIANLLANVRAHTPAGTAARVRLRRVRGPGGDRIELSVADDGPGVAAQHRDKLFDRFYRADPGRAHGQGGAGLGLSIVAAIVAAHDGQVQVEHVRAGLAVLVSLPTTSG